MNKGIFVTGTDTGVGKTFVAVGLIRALKDMGQSVCPMKPVETGCRKRNGEFVPEDTFNLIKASGVNEPLDMINPYRFRHPVAPSVAAEIEKVRIDKNVIVSAYRQLNEKYDIAIVEGAGGIMVPIYKQYLFIDLARELDLSVVIVSRPGLGTINHTLLTLEAAKNKGVHISGVIINSAVKRKTGLPEKTSPEVIENLGRVPVLGKVPFLDDYDSPNEKKIFKNIAKKIL